MVTPRQFFLSRVIRVIHLCLRYKSTYKDLHFRILTDISLHTESRDKRTNDVMQHYCTDYEECHKNNHMIGTVEMEIESFKTDYGKVAWE